MLVGVLLASVVVWTLLAAMLVSARLNYLLAHTHSEHRQAYANAIDLIEASRDRVLDQPGLGLVSDAAYDSCTWSVAIVAVDVEWVRYRVTVRLGRATVELEGTAHRSEGLDSP